MTIEKVIAYIQHTPYNTNRAILEEMLKTLIIAYGGSLDGPEIPGGSHVVYDGGIEE